MIGIPTVRFEATVSCTEVVKAEMEIKKSLERIPKTSLDGVIFGLKGCVLFMGPFLFPDKPERGIGHTWLNTFKKRIGRSDSDKCECGMRMCINQTQGLRIRRLPQTSRAQTTAPSENWRPL